MKTHIQIINQILEIAKPFVEQLAVNELERKINRLKSDNQKIEEQKALGNIRFLHANVTPYVEGMFNRYIENFKQEVVYDMIRSLSKNCDQGDKLVGDIILESCGTVEIQCKIERDGVVHNYMTRLISAGGYNIQCYHYRYITTTTLGASTNPKWLDKFLKIKELDSIIARYEAHIKEKEEVIANLNLKTDEENAFEYFILADVHKFTYSERIQIEESRTLPESYRNPKTIAKYSKLNKTRQYKGIEDYKKEINKLNIKKSKLTY